MTEIVARASELVMSVYATSFEVDYKSPSDPVTTADTLANELICSELAGIPGADRRRGKRPSYFARSTEPERVFSSTRSMVRVSSCLATAASAQWSAIGLLDGERPTAAVIQAPAQGVTFASVVGAGKRGLTSQPMAFSPLGGKQPGHAEGACIASSRSHRSHELESALAALKAGKNR